MLTRGAHRHVHRDDSEAHEGQFVAPPRPFRPIPEREDIAHDEEADVQVIEHDVDDVDSFPKMK